MLLEFVYPKMIPHNHSHVPILDISSLYIYLIHPRRPFSLGQMNIIVIFFAINLTRTVSNLVIKILHYISEAIHITCCNKEKKQFVSNRNALKSFQLWSFFSSFQRVFIETLSHLCCLYLEKSRSKFQCKWNFQLSVAYVGPLPTLSSHIKRQTPLTPIATPRVGSKFGCTT